ncbi:MAG: MarR family transcriptional regulator, partial [Thermomicrobiales bacterium]
SDDQLAAWEAFVFAHATAISRVERHMFEAGTISLTWYDVLVALSNAPDQRLRMGELADSLVLSRSGLTRLIDRIERAGLVQRELSPSDKRGAVAVLTTAGEIAVEGAWPHYAASIAQYFAHNLSTAEMRVLTSALSKVRDLRLEHD